MLKRVVSAEKDLLGRLNYETSLGNNLIQFPENEIGSILGLNPGKTTQCTGEKYK